MWIVKKFNGLQLMKVKSLFGTDGRVDKSSGGA